MPSTTTNMRGTPTTRRERSSSSQRVVRVRSTANETAHATRNTRRVATSRPGAVMARVEGRCQGPRCGAPPAPDRHDRVARRDPVRQRRERHDRGEQGTTSHARAAKRRRPTREASASATASASMATRITTCVTSTDTTTSASSETSFTRGSTRCRRPGRPATSPVAKPRATKPLRTCRVFSRRSGALRGRRRRQAPAPPQRARAASQGRRPAVKRSPQRQGRGEPSPR